ncbi:MAG TPA: nucleotidyltransferase domain-containing protein, partial [Thermoproteales archaeon]|nr:nucleotidyltransferase domain-containing protein [Thermoproteales archaeon]
MEYEGIVELLKKRMSEDLHSIILFGSATRPEDFAPGYSTIDLLILVKRKIPVIDRMKMIRELAGKANLIFLTPREFMVLAEDQHPLVLLSIKDSKVLVDDGTFTELSKNVRVGEKALKYFKSFSYTYLSLALESLLRGNYLDTPHYLY